MTRYYVDEEILFGCNMICLYDENGNIVNTSLINCGAELEGNKTGREYEIVPNSGNKIGGCDYTIREKPITRARSRELEERNKMKALYFQLDQDTGALKDGFEIVATGPTLPDTDSFYENKTPDKLVGHEPPTLKVPELFGHGEVLEAKYDYSNNNNLSQHNLDMLISYLPIDFAHRLIDLDTALMLAHSNIRITGISLKWSVDFYIRLEKPIVKKNPNRCKIISNEINLNENMSNKTIKDIIDAIIAWFAGEETKEAEQELCHTGYNRNRRYYSRENLRKMIEEFNNRYSKSVATKSGNQLHPEHVIRTLKIPKL